MTRDSMKQLMTRQVAAWGLILAGVLGLAIRPAGAAPLKLGYVNMAVLLREMPQSKAAERQLSQELVQQKQRLAKRLAAIQALRRTLHNPADRQSLFKRMQDQQRLDTMEARYRTSEEQYAEDFNLARNQALTNLQRLAVHAIHAYAQKHHYTLVLGNDLYFVAPTLNITAAVLAHLQALYQARSQSTPHAR